MRLYILCLLTAFAAGCADTQDKKKASGPSDEVLVKETDLAVRNIERASLMEKDIPYGSPSDSGTYKAFSEGDEIQKLVASGGSATASHTNEYYFSQGELVFVHIREHREKCKGEMTCAWELKHYFHQGHLFRSYKRGDVFAPGIPFDLEKRNFVINTEDNLVAEDTLQRNFSGYIRSLFTSPPR